jgi:5'-methylthioadenosine phosphorylase
MSACPEASLFREAEIAYALLCMSTDYDSWHPDTAAVNVEMVMGHMRHNGLNARRAVEAVLEALSREGWEGKETIMAGEKWKGAVGVVTGEAAGKGSLARKRLAWLFEGRFMDGEV